MTSPIPSRRTLAWLAGAALLTACLVTTRDEKLGGRWFIRWETSMIPESGGLHPYLHRRRWYGSMRVEENTWRYRYLGDDCVLYVAGNSDRGQLLAACADSTPVIIAPEVDDSTMGYVGDQGLTGDTIQERGHSTAVQEILTRAKASRRAK